VVVVKSLKNMNQEIKNLCESLIKQFDSIPEKRKEILTKITAYIQQRKDANKPISLVYICTHNARRSFFGQIWAQTAASFYHIENCTTYSGGMEVTRCHPNAINALQNQGFETQIILDSNNPIYQISFGEPVKMNCFSKLYNDESNPKVDFAAIMVCSDAETNCPFIPEAALRISTTYDDPKEFDGTPIESEKYVERANQIALECLYVFSKVI
jgi:protein-tyrosine phosphatase/arsenate reductase